MFPAQLPGSSLNDPYALDENEHQPGTSPLTLRVREWREEHPTEADIKDELSKLHRDNDGPKLHTILIMTAKHFDNSTRALLSSHHFDIRTDAEGVCVASRSTEWLTKTFPRQHARSERESDEYTSIAESRGYHRLPLSAFTRNAYEFENDDVWKSALREELTKSTHVATCSSVALEVMLHFAAFATESLPGATKTAYSINRDNANIQELLAGPWTPNFDVTASTRSEADPIEIFGQTESILTHARKIQGKTFIANPEAKDVEVVLIACIKAVAEDPLTKGTIFIPSMPGCKTWRQYISNEGATLCPQHHAQLQDAYIREMVCEIRAGRSRTQRVAEVRGRPKIRHSSISRWRTASAAAHGRRPDGNNRTNGDRATKRAVGARAQMRLTSDPARAWELRRRHQLASAKRQRNSITRRRSGRLLALASSRSSRCA